TSISARSAGTHLARLSGIIGLALESPQLRPKRTGFFRCGVTQPLNQIPRLRGSFPRDLVTQFVQLAEGVAHEIVQGCRWQRFQPFLRVFDAAGSPHHALALGADAVAES